MQFVIDTNVLVAAEQSNMDSVYFLASIAKMEELLVALDTEGRIVAEYRRNVDSQGFSAKWLNSLSRVVGKFHWYSGTVSKRVADRLSLLGFDRGDWKFIGVACGIPSERVIVADADSDWSDEVVEWLEADVGIQVVDSARAGRMCYFDARE